MRAPLIDEPLQTFRRAASIGFCSKLSKARTRMSPHTSLAVDHVDEFKSRLLV